MMESATKDYIFTSRQWLELRQDLLLTERQTEIIEQLLMGQGDKQIAQRLSMSMGTLRTHLDRLFRRFGVQDRFELATTIYVHFFNACKSCDCPRSR